MKRLNLSMFMVVGCAVLTSSTSAQCADWHALSAFGYAEAVTSVTRGIEPGSAYLGGWCVCSAHESAYTPEVFSLTNGVLSQAVSYPTWIFGYVMDVAMFDLGTGPVLHAWGTMSTSYGQPRYIARIVGGTPTAATGAIPGVLQTVAVFDSGSGPAYHIATADAVLYWSGSAWVILGATSGTVSELVVHYDGSGPALYAGGTITTVAGVSALGVARWNGSTWSSVPGLAASGSGTVNVTELASLWTAAGHVLVAGGSFSDVGGAAANGIASFDGTAWTALGAGFPFPVTSVSDIDTFDSGTGAGPQLVVSALGAGTLRAIASLDGTSWSTISGAPGGPTIGGYAIAVVNALGTSTQGLVTVNPHVWPWGSISFDAFVFEACDLTGELGCLGDGSLAACPCGNESPSAQRAGCLHSLGSGGALRAHGVAELAHDSLVLEGTSMTNSSVLYFQGAALHAPTPFGDGLKCTGGPFMRLGTKENVAGASSYPSGADAPVSVRGAINSAGTRHYQARFRNVATFCTTETFNYTNSLSLVWQP